MNFSILIFLCAVVYQIADHQCNADLYSSCKSADKKYCSLYGEDPFCGSSCKSRCYPDIFSCCDCVINKRNCFSSASEVNLENGKSVTMSELQLGDQVQTGNEYFTRTSLKA